MLLEDSNGSILIHIEVVIKHEEASEKNIIIGSLIVVLGICISLGIYTYQTKTTLTHYHTEVSVNHATKDIKLYSDGNDVNLMLTDDAQSNIKLNGYFSKTALKKNDHAQKNNNHLNFNFTDNKEHTFINKRSGKQHIINFAIPVNNQYKIENISIITNGGDVHIKDNNKVKFEREFDTNGGSNKFAISKSRGSIPRYTLKIKTNGGNITNFK